MRKSHNDRDLHASVSFAPDGQNLEGVEEALKGQAVEGAAYPIVCDDYDDGGGDWV